MSEYELYKKVIELNNMEDRCKLQSNALGEVVLFYCDKSSHYDYDQYGNTTAWTNTIHKKQFYELYKQDFRHVKIELLEERL
jgi:hypothetical protein